MIFPFGVTVTLVRRVLSSSRDEYGNDAYTEVSSDVPGVPVWASGMSEITQGRDTVISDLTAFLTLPAGVDVASIDKVRVDGNDYEVVGQPNDFPSPLTGFDPGVLVQLRRVTG